jgi:hypothetical protein
MSWKHLVLVGLFAGTAGACDAKATDAECTEACGNAASLYLGALDQKTASDETLKQMGEASASMAKEMASMMLEYLRHECETRCKAQATRKQTDCLKAAKSTEEAGRCN